jgi:hypothetical protein
VGAKWPLTEEGEEQSRAKGWRTGEGHISPDHVPEGGVGGQGGGAVRAGRELELGGKLGAYQDLVVVSSYPRPCRTAGGERVADRKERGPVMRENLGESSCRLQRATLTLL